MKSLEDRFRPLLLAVFSDPMTSWPEDRRLTDLGARSRILVVRTDRIGDAIVSTPLLRSLRQRFPDAKIDILLGEKNAVAAPLLPYVDSRPILRRGHVVSAIRRLRRRRYDLLLNLQLKHSVNASLLSRSIGPRIILEYPVEAPFARARPSPHHMVSMTSKLLVPLGVDAIEDGDGERFPLEVTIPEASERRAERLGARLLGTAEGGPRVLINLSAGSVVRRPSVDALSRRLWAPERSAQLAIRLREAGFIPVLCSAPEDTPLLQRSLALSSGSALALPPAEDYSDFAALVGLVDIVVSPDTSTTHLAAALGKPTVALFNTEGNGRTWGPWGVPSRIMTSPSGISGIEAEGVFEAVTQLHGNRGSLQVASPSRRGV